MVVALGDERRARARAYDRESRRRRQLEPQIEQLLTKWRARVQVLERRRYALGHHALEDGTHAKVDELLGIGHARGHDEVHQPAPHVGALHGHVHLGLVTEREQPEELNALLAHGKYLGRVVQGSRKRGHHRMLREAAVEHRRRLGRRRLERSCGRRAATVQTRRPRRHATVQTRRPRRRATVQTRRPRRRATVQAGAVLGELRNADEELERRCAHARVGVREGGEGVLRNLELRAHPDPRLAPQHAAQVRERGALGASCRGSGSGGIRGGLGA